jgi:hypothetical protein
MIGNNNSNGQPLRVIWGAKAIGAYIGLPTRKAFYLLEKGLLPGEKNRKDLDLDRGPARRPHTRRKTPRS